MSGCYADVPPKSDPPTVREVKTTRKKIIIVRKKSAITAPSNAIMKNDATESDTRPQDKDGKLEPPTTSDDVESEAKRRKISKPPVSEGNVD